MADIVVENTLTNPTALKATRYEPLSTAYGRLKVGEFEIGDTLVFSKIASKEIVHARFISKGAELEILPGTDLSSAIDCPVDPAEDLAYVIQYIRGTGSIPGASGPLAKSLGVCIQVKLVEIPVEGGDGGGEGGGEGGPE